MPAELVYVGGHLAPFALISLPTGLSFCEDQGKLKGAPEMTFVECGSACVTLLWVI